MLCLSLYVTEGNNLTMNTSTEATIIDAALLRRIFFGGAIGIRSNMKEINDLNVFPVPDGDTGTNMLRTLESGLCRLSDGDDNTLGELATEFAKGVILGARGNSGVILSQYISGFCSHLAGKTSATVREIAEAANKGVARAYSAVANPVEGTMLTVVRESAEYVLSHIDDSTTIEQLLRMAIEEGSRSLARTKEILPVLRESDVVDSGGAGCLSIVVGALNTLVGGEEPIIEFSSPVAQTGVNYDLFTRDSALTFGYCTECLVRLQTAKCDPDNFDANTVVEILASLGCDSIVSVRDGDILKIHAHTPTPSLVLDTCQKYGEFLEVKIENMTLQHTEGELRGKKKTHKKYAVVTVCNGEGLTALFESLGADAIIDGGQSSNPSSEDFLKAFGEVDADHIIVLPNNSNIILTARQAADLWEGGNVVVIPTKTVAQGYAAISVFNITAESIEDQITDMTFASDGVISGEIVYACRDAVVNGTAVENGKAMAILDGAMVATRDTATEAAMALLDSVEDLDLCELITLFVGKDVSDVDRVALIEAIEERYPELEVVTHIGGQNLYSYLIAIE